MKFSISQRNKIIRKVNKFKKAKKFNFGSIELFLNKHTLIPHPNTFQLIQLAVNILKTNSWIKTVIDAGTGSGVIAIYLAKKFPTKTFFASDVSKKAMYIANKNALCQVPHFLDHFFYQA